jgi:hypothetical protein
MSNLRWLRLNGSKFSNMPKSMDCFSKLVSGGGGYACICTSTAGMSAILPPWQTLSVPERTAHFHLDYAVHCKLLCSGSWLQYYVGGLVTSVWIDSQQMERLNCGCKVPFLPAVQPEHFCKWVVQVGWPSMIWWHHNWHCCNEYYNIGQLCTWATNLQSMYRVSLKLWPSYYCYTALLLHNKEQSTVFTLHRGFFNALCMYYTPSKMNWLYWYTS